jgi:ABC-2 type transport system permease protein
VIVKFNPLAYGVDGIRGCLGGAINFGLMTDFWILGIAVVFLVALGGYLFSKIQI